MIKRLAKRLTRNLSGERKEQLKGVYMSFVRLRRLIKWLPQNIHASVAWMMKRDSQIEDVGIFEKSVFSQNGEDGIIRLLLHKIGSTNKFCVEFGAGIGLVCNTRLLVERQGWSFLWMDARDNLPPHIKNERINAENINNIFKKYSVPKEFDILSIDIDSNDYWVWKALEGFRPRIVIMEYNSSVPANKSRTVEYDPNMEWDGTSYFGASLLALYKLGRQKGYTLIACDSKGINAFFIRDDLVKDRFKVRQIEEIYKSPGYGVLENGKYTGHPRSAREMIAV